MKFNYITTPEKARVEVDGIRRYQWGDKLPSVTTILSAVPDQSKSIALARWRERVGEEEAERIKNTAAVRGTIMHRILEGEMTVYFFDDSGKTIRRICMAPLKAKKLVSNE